MQRKALSEKIMVLGIDGMDPRMTRRLVLDITFGLMVQ